MAIGVFDVTAQGALGDGKNDDTSAIQKAIDAAAAYGQAGQPQHGGTVYFPAGTYSLGTPGPPPSYQPPNLYVPGNVNLEGGPGAVLKLNALPAPTPLEPNPQIAPSFWINLGAAGPSDNSPNSLWSGRISGLRFTINANIAVAPDTPPNLALYLKSQLDTFLLFLHNANGFVIENNYFDLEGFGTNIPSPESISGGANAPWNPVAWRLSRGIIRGNTIKASMGYYGGAGITIGGSEPNTADHITIEDNYVSGVADEVIGIHAVNHAVVRNNFCSGVKAGILITHCQNFMVEGNYVERCAAAPMPLWGLSGQWWQGGLLLCGIEGAAYAPPCTDGLIANNECVVSPPPGSGPPSVIPGTPTPTFQLGLAAVPGPAGTNLPPGNYYAQITFVGPPSAPGLPPLYAESSPGPEASLQIANSADVLQVSLPSLNLWKPGTNYVFGDLVSYGGSYYASFLALNKGNVPGLTPLTPTPQAWAPVAAYNVYVGLTTGGEQLQGSCLAGALSWVEPASGLVKDGAPAQLGVHGFLQLMGLRRAIVAGNLLRCDTQFVARPALMVCAESGEVGFSPPAYWSDSEGLDSTGPGTPDVARPRDILIQGNRAVGAAVNGAPAEVYTAGKFLPYAVVRPGVILMGEGTDDSPLPDAATIAGIAGPITWQGNEANSFRVFGQQSSFSVSNRVIGGAGDGAEEVDGYLVPDAVLLWSGAVVPQPKLRAAARNGGGPSFYPLRQGIIFYVKATLSSPLGAGDTVTVQLAKKAAAGTMTNSLDDLAIDSTSPNSKRRYYGVTSPGINNRFAELDSLQVFVTYAPVGATTPGLSILVEFYGMYTDNNANRATLDRPTVNCAQLMSEIERARAAGIRFTLRQQHVFESYCPAVKRLFR
jgi:hypothetical protein